MNDDSECERLRRECAELRRRVADLEANAHFRLGFERSAVAQSMSSPDGRMLQVNDAFVELLGYGADELLGKSFQLITHPDDRANSAAVREALIGTRQHAHFEKRFVTKSGATIWAQACLTLVRDHDGKPLHFFGTFVDITARRQAEAALRREQARTTAILSGIADTFYALDSDWRFTVVNPAAERAPFGRTASELLGRRIWDLYPGLIGTPIDRRYRDAAQHQRLEHYEAQSPINGRWYEVFMQGWEGGVDVYMRDISDRREAEARLRDSEERYRRVFEVESDVILLVDERTLRVIDANAVAIRTYGYSREELLALTAADLSAETEKSRTAIAEHETAVPLRWHRRKDGSRFPVEIAGSYFESGGHKIHVAAIRDISERQRADEALRTSEEWHRVLVDQSRDAILTVAPPQWKFRSANPASLAMFGVPSIDAMTSLGPWDVSPERQPNGVLSEESVKQAIEVALRTGSCGFEWTHQRSDGTPFTAHVTLSRMQVQGDSFIQSVVRDISSEKQAKRALKEREAAEQEAQQRFERLFRNNPALMALASLPERRFVDINEAFVRVTGYTRSEVIGKTSAELGLIPDEDDQKLIVDRLQADGRIVDLELNLRARDGSLRRGLFSGETFVSQDKRYSLTVVIDITDRKRAEDENRRQAGLIASLLDSIPDVIFFKDLNGVYLGCNPPFADFVGRARTEIIGKTDHDLFGEEVADSFRVHDRRMMEELRPRHNEEWVTYPDGRRVLLDTLKTPYWGQDGTLVGVLGISRDITERNRIQNELVKAVQGAEAASKAKSEFLAIMSHEIRTPMNGVIGMTGLLLESKLDSNQQRYAEIIRMSAESLLSLINDILDFSKIEAGRLELEPIDFSLRGLFDDLTAMLATRAEQKGLELTCSSSPDVPPQLCGDVGRLRQILVNLVGNAIKFTSKGSVSVRVHLLESAAERLVLRFSVRDTGIGIPADKIGLLFEKFSQVDTSSTRKFSGTGLGLAISKQLAQLMGGEIGVNSEEGRGSEFWFTSHLAKATRSDERSAYCTDLRRTPALVADDNTTPARRQSRSGGIAATTRVLLVEDNATNQQVALAILRKLGVRVDAVGDGMEAINSLRTIRYSLVLMDVQMPVMDGLEAARIIRSPEGKVLDPKIPIIAMTANAMQGDRERCLAAGMDDYLSKPVMATELVAALERWQSESGSSPPQSPETLSRTEPQTLPNAVPRVFDETSLLARVGDDRDLARAIVRSFLDDLPKQLDALESRIVSGDATGIQRQLHSLRGAAATVGATLLVEFVQALEDAARAGDRATIGRGLGELKERCAGLRRAILASSTFGPDDPRVD